MTPLHPINKLRLLNAALQAIVMNLRFTQRALTDTLVSAVSWSVAVYCVSRGLVGCFGLRDCPHTLYGWETLTEVVPGITR